MKLVRDRLTPEQQADLDRVDAWWRAHPCDFNDTFRPLHNYASKSRALEGYGVSDGRGEKPVHAIPADHWWWWPLSDEGESEG